MTRTLLLLACAAALAGCATKTHVEVQRVNVPVPVECKEPMPERPAMPTEALGPGATLDAFVQAATAEIERREGYEGELRSGLESCRRPVALPERAR